MSRCGEKSSGRRAIAEAEAFPCQGPGPSRLSECRASENMDVQIPGSLGQGEECVSQAEFCKVVNDLKATIELSFGELWNVLYPHATIILPGAGVEISIRLRDDPEVHGHGVSVFGRMLHASQDFGDFGSDAVKFSLIEESVAAKECRLRQKREETVNKELNARVNRFALGRQRCCVLCSVLMISIFMGLMIFCTVLAVVGAPDELQAAGLSLGFVLLWNCACVGFGGIAGVFKDSAQVQNAVRAARPELQNYEEDGVEVREMPLNDDLDCDWREGTFWGSGCCILAGGLVCMCAMVVAYDSYNDGHDGFTAAFVLLVLPWAVVVGLWCCVVSCPALAGKTGLSSGVGPARLLGLIIFHWPWWVLGKCFGKDFFFRTFVQPTTASLREAVLSTHQYTIVFEGNVLPGRNTVASWPGKYESAWDALVAGARQDHISAAVVFLPEGSRHFGIHDRIPAIPELQDLQGSCWCTPLYGEQKPWGCRWWSCWIKNVEDAARLGATLEVYFFNGKKGLGKVKDFTTAGEEHKRREKIVSKKAEFEQSAGFIDALQAGLTGLSKEKGSDSSSPYSREVHRLFLAWLPEDERRFLEESEGLGNSQKAEVAWLERKGYSYVGKEVFELADSSPKAIAPAKT